MDIKESAIKYKLEKREGSIVKVDLEIDSSEREVILDKAYKYLVQKINIPGFRKGKAPRPILERFLGNDFYIEAIRIAAKEIFNYILKKENLEPYSLPDFNIPSYWKENEKLAFSFTVEVVPKIRIGKYKNFKIDKRDLQVSSEEINKVIEQLKLQNSKLKPVENREIIEGDLVYVERETRDGRKLEPLWIRINGSYDPEIEKELIGMKIGEQKIIETKFPDDYLDREFAGKTIPITWKIKKVWTYEFIEDDELAHKYGLESIDELYNKILDNIFNAKLSQERERLIDEIIDKILENSEIDPPQSMVLTITEVVLNDVQRDLKNEGKTWDEYLREIGKTEEEYIESLKEIAKRKIQEEMILDYIAEKEKIEVTEDEMRIAIEEFAKEENKDINVIRSTLEREGKMESLRKSILREKVKEFLINENTK
jgi:trigger factor